jgi:RNA recognition motif-containing protein
MQIYAGNLPLTMTDDELRGMFEKYGTVRVATIGRDKKSGESQGYGFVEMPVKAEARAAIEALRGVEKDGKPLRVRALKPGDEFHQHVLGTQGGGPNPAGRGFQGNVGPRGTGAIRRSGKRGS